jgi:hypothetical protein
MNDTTPSAARSYDLYLTAGRPRFRWRNTDRGVTVSDDGLAWTNERKPDGASFKNIASIRLQSGGDWKNPLNSCHITFADGYQLNLSDGSEWGKVDHDRTPVYRDFLRDLHARMVKHGTGATKFLRGYADTNFRVVLVAASLLGIIGVAGPIVLLFIVPAKLEVLGILAAGSVMCWPLYTMVRNNAPRPYDPRHLPEELME